MFAGALPARAQKPSPQLLTPDNCVVLLIDHQPQMGFGTKSIEMTRLRNNLAGLSKATQLFKVPVVLTTVSESFAGAIWPEIKSVFPNQPIIERTTMNSWDYWLKCRVFLFFYFTGGCLRPHHGSSPQPRPGSFISAQR